MVNLMIIAIGLILLTIFIHKKPHFFGKKRLETILITVSLILVFSEWIAPFFNLEFNLKDNLINGIYFIVATALVSDIIQKKERR